MPETTGRREGRARTVRLLTAGVFVLTHVVAFLCILIVIPPMPASTFADRHSGTWRTPDGGLRFNVCHDCEPGFVFARRAFGWGFPGNDDYTQTVLLANLPGRIVAEIAGSVVEDPLGNYGAMWVETLVFSAASIAQWWGLGWVVGGRLGRSL